MPLPFPCQVATNQNPTGGAIPNHSLRSIVLAGKKRKTCAIAVPTNDIGPQGPTQPFHDSEIGEKQRRSAARVLG